MFTEELKLIKEAEEQADEMRREARISAKNFVEETDSKANKMIEEAFAEEKEQCDACLLYTSGPGHLTYGLKMSKVGQMREEIGRLKKQYPQIDILLGVEANTIRVAPFIDLSEEDKKQFDIILAGYHYGIPKAGMVPNFVSEHTGLFHSSASSLLVKNTDMILRALYENKIDILTHPGDKGRCV